MRGHILSLLLMLVALWPAALLAQEPPELATLVADTLAIEADSRLVADGHVEVFFRDVRLTASRVVYDSQGNRLQIEGPIRIEDASGQIFLAEQADLSGDLQEGVLQSARLVLGQQLQLASSQIVRASGRYTQMSRTVASACKVCAGNPTPLWEVRARRVIHDQQERQLYFEDASLRLAGVPVFYLPRLRLPDPTVTRANGFLVPSIKTTSELGTGLKLPYFIALGDSRDLTVTPFASTRNGRSVQLQYRQAFDGANMTLDAALARDDIRPGETRGFFRAIGDAELPEGFTLDYNLAWVSDPGYLLDYDLSDKDRIDSRIVVSRTRADDRVTARLIEYKSLRDGDNNATLPRLVSDLTYQRRFGFGPLGGQGGLKLQTHGHFRTSENPADTNGDGISEGRDTRRASVRLDWRRSWVLPGGLVGTALGEVSADAYRIEQDYVYGGRHQRAFGAVAAELRWPLLKAEATGGSQVLEPVVQVVFAPQGRESLPNEDSTIVEFDEGNLFSLNRFPGSDAVERGMRANLGVSWTRTALGGWTLGATAGRVLRATDEDQFSLGSGLQGTSSDWLAALQLSGGGLVLTNRALFDDSFAVTKGEVRLDGGNDRYSVAASYLWAVADPEENRDINTSELTFDGTYDVTPGWTANVLGRYDLVANEPSRAGLGLAFRNECVLVDLSLSRRFTSSTNVQPTTNVGVSVDLLGFGSGAEAGPARMCRR